MCPSPGGIHRHTGLTQYLKLVAAEADRVLPSLHGNDGLACESLSLASDPGETFDLTSVSCCRARAEWKLRQPTNPAMKADHLSHKLPVSILLVVDEMICAVKGTITNDLAEKEEKQVNRLTKEI
ncbi:uncharacterized [Tachysurus ichikawai]